MIGEAIEYTAAQLTDMAIDWLAARYAGAMIVRELSIGDYGAAMLDLAAITETEIIGVEIKGIGDSPTRLKLQGVLYSKAAQRMYLLPTPALLARCEKHAPSLWQLLCIEDGEIKHHGWYARSANKQPPKLPTAPAQLLQAFEKRELVELAGRLRVAASMRMSVVAIATEIAELVPLRELVPAACKLLRERDWAKYGRENRVRWAA